MFASRLSLHPRLSKNNPSQNAWLGLKRIVPIISLWLNTDPLPEDEEHPRLNILPRRAVCREWSGSIHRIVRRLHPVGETRNIRDAHLVNAALLTTRLLCR